MSSRIRVLARVRAACGRSIPIPPPEPAKGTRLSWTDFGQALAAGGGTAHAAVDLAALPDRLRQLAGALPALAGRAAGLLGASPASADPYELANTACLAATGQCAVARTGSVLVDDRDAPVRAHLALPDWLILLVPEHTLVDDLPDLYARYGGTRAPAYFTLITGPSKTADIEQQLVIGAHGPRRLDVIPVLGMLESS